MKEGEFNVNFFNENCRGNFFIDKKGISDVITYLLIIVISMIALGILWVIVSNFLSQGSEQVSLQGLTISLNIKGAQLSSNDVSVTVSRKSGAGDLTGVKFIFSDGNNTESFDNKTALPQLEEKTFIFNLRNLNPSALKTVSIAPIYSSSGKETTGNIVDTFQFSSAQTSGGTGGTGGATCGDHQCVSPETAANCAADCRSDNTGGICGNNVCEAGENSVSCSGDCNNLNPVCGDTQCVSPETAANCAADCGTANLAGTVSCGDDKIGGNEQCDDGDAISGDGCSGTDGAIPCQVESGWSCIGLPSRCAQGMLQGSCGDRIIQSPNALMHREQCDDGGAISGDGCDSECKIEEGYYCLGEPSVCNLINQQTQCVPKSCSELGKQCGNWNDGCGGRTSCLCSSGSDYCTGDGMCEPDLPLNSGTIGSVWPPGAAKYFDSEYSGLSGLPKDSVAINSYIGKYVKFTTGSEAGTCRKIEYAEYLNAGTYDKSYLRVEVVVNINGGDGYSVYRSSSCGGSV